MAALFRLSSVSQVQKPVVKTCRSFSVSPLTAADVGFIGLGQMGFRMAQNLQKAGKELVVFDVAPGPVDELLKRAASPKEVAQGAKIVITMLPSNPHVQSVYTGGPDSLISAATSDHLFIDASTIDPNVARTVQAAMRAKGSKTVDAPVSGGITGAANATLTFMVGGSKEFEAAGPILQLMGKNIVHCGEGSCGQVAKVCNNLVLGISMIGVSEAMNLGIKLGMDKKTLAGIFNTSSARCWSSDAYNPVPGVMEGVPASRNYDGGFACDLMAKDLSLAVSAANTAKQPLLLGGAAHQAYNLMHAQGLGAKDFGAVYKFLSETKMPEA